MKLSTELSSVWLTNFFFGIAWATRPRDRWTWLIILFMAVLLTMRGVTNDRLITTTFLRQSSVFALGSGVMSKLLLLLLAVMLGWLRSCSISSSNSLTICSTVSQSYMSSTLSAASRSHITSKHITVDWQQQQQQQQQQHLFNGPLSGTIWVSQYQKGKTNLDLLEQGTVSGGGISWAICKSAPRHRQMTMPAPHHSAFYRPDALPASKHWRQLQWTDSNMLFKGQCTNV